MENKQIDVSKLELWEIWKMIAEQQAVQYSAQNNIAILQSEIARREVESGKGSNN